MNWKKFRKRPVVVSAVRWDPQTMNWKDFPEEHQVGGKECPEGRLTGIIGQWGDRSLSILTLEGAMAAYPGDWIVQGIKNELYPVRDDIFRATYEEVNEA